MRPVVELVGVDVELIAQVGDRYFLDEVPFEDGDLLVVGKVTTLLVHEETSVQVMLTRTERSSRFDGGKTLSDGELTDMTMLTPPLPAVIPTIGRLLDEYEGSVQSARNEPTTRMTEAVHLGHFRRLLDLDKVVQQLTNADLQGYINRRQTEKGIRGGKAKTDTIQKEIETFRAIWNNFARSLKVVQTDFKEHFGKLTFPKRRSKPPFQTFEQIERNIARGGLTDEQKAELWDCLFLDRHQIKEVLDLVKANAVATPWLYPMFVFAAHTGARRSEMLRSQIDDFDFTNGVVQLREKKRDKEAEFTFRHVSISRLLAKVMQEWFHRHPGGRFTLCDESGVGISPKGTYYHFEKVLTGTIWEVCQGWHLFRHSLASIMACEGIDQRIIDATLGHQTEDMRKRYRHLFPSKQREALASVFR